MNRWIFCALAALFVSSVKADPILHFFGSPTNLEEGKAHRMWIYTDRVFESEMRVDLISSRPDVVAAPPFVTIPVGQAHAIFEVYCFDNEYIDGPVTAAIEAKLGRLAQASHALQVADDESPTMAFHMGSEWVIEGSPAVGAIALGGLVRAPLTITMQAEGRLVVPSTVVVPAGHSDISFPISVPDDSEYQTNQAVKLTATAAGFSSIDVDLEIRNDDVGGYGISTDADVAPLGGVLNVVVRTVDPDGFYMWENRTRLVEVLLVMADGSEIPASPMGVTLDNGTWRGQLQIPETLPGPFSIRVKDADGISARSNVLDILRTLSVQAADLVWDERRGRIYAAIPASGGARSNSVVAIDPVTGEITKSLPLAGNPQHLAITSGQEYLYVALQATGKVARVDLESFTATLEFPVSLNENLFAADIETVKGKPELLVVSRSRTTVPTHAGVAVYNNGVQLPVTTAGHPGSNVIEPSSDPTLFFGLGAEGDSHFRRLRLSEDGIREIDATENLISTYEPGVLEADGDLAIWSTGVVVHGAEKRVVGDLGKHGVPAPDLSINRIFYLEKREIFARDYSLSAYDATSLERLRGARLPVIFSTGANLIRAGNRLAFTADGQVMIASGMLVVPAEPAADISVTVTPSSAVLKVGEDLTYTVRVTNNSANPARSVFVRFTFGGHREFQDMTSDEARIYKYTWTPGAEVSVLEPHSEAVIFVKVVPLSAGIASLTVTMDALALDSIATNNVATANVSVGYQTAYESTHRVYVDARSVAWDAQRGVLWTSARTKPYENSVVAIDPYTGAITRSIGLKGTPGKVALSDNGRYLYVSLDNLAAIQRIKLETDAADLKIPLHASPASEWLAEDIEVLPGDGTSIVVARRSGGIRLRHMGVAVFDGAVQRPETTPAFDGTFRLAPMGVPNTFAAWEGNYADRRVRVLQINANGAHRTEKSAPGDWRYDAGEIAGGGGLIFESTGRVLDSATFATKESVASGVPIVDAEENQLFMVGRDEIRGYQLQPLRWIGAVWTGATNNELPSEAIRWGRDGFAMIEGAGFLRIMRSAEPFTGKFAPELTEVEVTSAGGLVFTVNYRVTPGTALAIETSDDLVTWQRLTGGWTERILSESSDAGGTYRTVQYTLDAAGPNRFVKLVTVPAQP